MSDPITFSFRNESDELTVDLYSHWGGRDACVTLANALNAARPRFDDPAYATRIAICAIIDDSSSDDETGFGFSASRGEFVAFETIIVDWARSTVTFADTREPNYANETTVSIDDFIAIADDLVI